MVYEQPRICPGESDAQNSLRFIDTDGSLNLGQTTRPSDSQQERGGGERTCRIVDFAVMANHKVKLKENEKRFKCPDLANMKMAVIPILIGVLGTATKGFGKGTGNFGNKRTSGDRPKLQHH